ncbi:transmembrane protease serine 11D-like [Schistocerca piceifrons]|uniref:transmembrane protease serine 11D-like n=1 Tax=Schistocerca piceifrons TaxID=274613 RepID=UPI001F5E976C|nr:transmembrane protease serine 11D-like [Schistocerca piceifrons]
MRRFPCQGSRPRARHQRHGGRHRRLPLDGLHADPGQQRERRVDHRQHVGADGGSLRPREPGDARRPRDLAGLLVLRLDVAQMIKHADFHMSTDDADNDIGVIQASEPFPLGSNIQVVNLPADGYDAPAGLPVTISGWGVTATEFNPVYLQRADMHVLDRDTCRDMMADVAAVTLGMVCAGDPTMAICYGDSGSPLVYGDMQIGVAYWTRPGCISTTSVYASVGNFRTWIRNNTGV